MRHFVVAVSLILAFARVAQTREKSAEIIAPIVKVCIVRLDIRPDLEYSRILAARIFERIGIKLDWSCSRSGDQPIMVDVKATRDESDYSNTLAEAQPFGNRICIYYNRLHAAGILDRAHVLAYVLAHELTHVLQGINRHSDTGIMKRCWNLHDVGEMSTDALPFTQYDILLMREGIVDRMSRVKAD